MTALAEAETLLNYCNKNYRTLDSRGLTLSCMALPEKKDDYIQRAREAFKFAREINSAVGNVNRIVRMFDELRKADGQGILEDVWL